MKRFKNVAPVLAVLILTGTAIPVFAISNSPTPTVPKLPPAKPPAKPSAPTTTTSAPTTPTTAVVRDHRNKTSTTSSGTSTTSSGVTTPSTPEVRDHRNLTPTQVRGQVLQIRIKEDSTMVHSANIRLSDAQIAYTKALSALNSNPQNADLKAQVDAALRAKDAAAQDKQSAEKLLNYHRSQWMKLCVPVRGSPDLCKIQK